MLQTNIQQHLHIEKEHCAPLLLSPGFYSRLGKGVLNAAVNLSHSEMDSAPTFRLTLYLKLYLGHCIWKDTTQGNRDISLQKLPDIFCHREGAGYFQKSWVEGGVGFSGGLPKEGKWVARRVCHFASLLRNPKSKINLFRYFCGEFQPYLNGPVFTLKFIILLCCLAARYTLLRLLGEKHVPLGGNQPCILCRRGIAGSLSVHPVPKDLPQRLVMVPG